MTLIPMSGEKLQAARQAAAERFQTIAAKYTHPHWKVTYRKNLSGRAWPTEGRMEVPRPVTRRALHIYLHECGHIFLGHTGKVPRHQEEAEAESYAFEVMRKEGVPIPRKSMKRAKSYVARKIRQAKKRGAKKIDPNAAAFAKSGTRLPSSHPVVRALNKVFGR